MAKDGIIERLADKIYSACFGHLDDRHFRAQKTGEIIDWLTDGDSEAPVEQLIEDWRSYDSWEPNLR